MSCCSTVDGTLDGRIQGNQWWWHYDTLFEPYNTPGGVRIRPYETIIQGVDTTIRLCILIIRG